MRYLNVSVQVCALRKIIESPEGLNHKIWGAQHKCFVEKFYFISLLEHSPVMIQMKLLGMLFVFSALQSKI